MVYPRAQCDMLSPADAEWLECFVYERFLQAVTYRHAIRAILANTNDVDAAASAVAPLEHARLKMGLRTVSIALSLGIN